MKHEPAHEEITANINRLRMVGQGAAVIAAGRLEAWHEALQMIATGSGDGKTDAEVMRGIAQEALSWQ